MIKTNNCIICDSNNLHTITSNLCFVSSDIKILKCKAIHAICKKCSTIQKIKDKKYNKNITKIYENYDGFKKFNKNDQKKLLKGNFTNRCDIIFNKIIKKYKNIKTVLDYGSGNGAMIDSFLIDKKNYEIFATDFKNNLPIKTKKNTRFKKFFKLSNINNNNNNKFDLITLIHTLEHLTDPKETLNKLKNKLNDNGKIFIQIPDYSSNPYDLIVYDHTAHYTINSIKKLAEEIDMGLEFLSNKILDCEFSFILTKNRKKNLIKNNSFKDTYNNFKEAINFLNNQIIFLNKLKNFTILGTSITATWVYGSVKGCKIDFIDEDKTKYGIKHLSKTIKNINDKKMFNNNIFLPFPPIKLRKIFKRLSSTYKYKFFFPK